MSKIWFTADTHFGHQRTLELSKRPYNSVEEMDSDMIEKWNSVVGEDDVVYHLGDFGTYESVKQLNGNIHLVLGNYERDDIYSEKITLNYLFDNFYSVYERIDIAIFNNKEYRLLHEPSRAYNDKFKLFGHIHKLQMVKRNGLNVGVDCHNFYPIDLETVEFYRNAIENHYDKDVFEG